MLKLKWEEIEKPEKNKLIQSVNPYLPLPLVAELTIAKRAKLSFYDNFYLYEFIDIDSIPPIARNALFDGNNFYLIDYTKEPILAANQTAPIKLNKQNVADYLKLYFKFTKGPHGFFIPAENIEDLPLKTPLPPRFKKALPPLMSPLVVEENSDGFLISLVVLFNDALFSTSVQVNISGSVSINAPQMLIENLPVFSTDLI